MKKLTLSQNEIIEILKNANGKSDAQRKLKFTKLEYVTDLYKKYNIQEPVYQQKSKYITIEKTCPQCFKTFETKKGHKDEKTVCSHSCANSYYRSGENHPNFKADKKLKDDKEKPKLFCTICSTQLKGMQTKFCSTNCKAKAHENNTYEAQALRGLRRKLEVVEIFGGGCTVCGYNKNIAALHFHHIDPTTKLFEVDLRSFSNNSMKTIETELTKCALLCANCHAEEHNPGLTLERARKVVKQKNVNIPIYEINE